MEPLLEVTSGVKVCLQRRVYVWRHSEMDGWGSERTLRGKMKDKGWKGWRGTRWMETLYNSHKLHDSLILSFGSIAGFPLHLPHHLSSGTLWDSCFPVDKVSVNAATVTIVDIWKYHWGLTLKRKQRTLSHTLELVRHLDSDLKIYNHPSNTAWKAMYPGHLVPVNNWIQPRYSGVSGSMSVVTKTGKRKLFHRGWSRFGFHC